MLAGREGEEEGKEKGGKVVREDEGGEKEGGRKRIGGKERGRDEGGLPCEESRTSLWGEREREREEGKERGGKGRREGG
jgi:hypothetical protein